MTPKPKQYPITTRPSTPEEVEWIKYGQELQKEAPKRYEEAAKFLAGLVGICLTIFLKLDGTALAGHGWLPKTAALIWVVSVILSFLVFLPFKYRTDFESAAAIEHAVSRSAQRKRVFLMISALLFLLGLLLLVSRFVAWL